MKTIPSNIWDGEALFAISEAEADYNHLYQTLIGDTTDGFKGCPGIGPKKAEVILEGMLSDETKDCPQGLGCVGCLRCCTSAHAWPLVVAAYAKMGLKETDAITQARLARILRWTDWDNEAKTPILWTPPSVTTA